jgi:dipeptidyl-peptidase-4
LREVLGVDRDEVLFTASTDPTQDDLWSYCPSDGGRKLTAEPGVHSGVRRGGTLVHTARTPDRPGRRVTVERPGQPDVVIESLAQQPVLHVHATPLVLGPRELRAELFLPSWHGPGSGKLPVLLDPYGGPAGQKVTAMQGWLQLTSQWLAEQGFAVLVADGRGTPGRGPVWEREVYGDVLGPALEARSRRWPRPPAVTPSSISAGSASGAGRSAVRSRRWQCCAARMSSTPRWPGPHPPTCGCTTPTGGNGSTATLTRTPSGT